MGDPKNHYAEVELPQELLSKLLGDGINMGVHARDFTNVDLTEATDLVRHAYNRLIELLEEMGDDRTEASPGGGDQEPG